MEPSEPAVGEQMGRDQLAPQDMHSGCLPAPLPGCLLFQIALTLGVGTRGGPPRALQKAPGSGGAWPPSPAPGLPAAPHLLLLGGRSPDKIYNTQLNQNFRYKHIFLV